MNPNRAFDASPTHGIRHASARRTEATEKRRAARYEYKVTG